MDSDCLWIEVGIKGNEQVFNVLLPESLSLKRLLINLWLAFSPVNQRNSPRLINIKRFNDRSKGEQQRVKDRKVMHQG